jgi:L-ectoine synthase
MIVRSLKDIIGTERDVKAENGNWESRRLLLNSDALGFSLHDTIIHAGTETLIWYKHHLEAVYCIEGEGEVETTENGRIYPIKAGTVYALNGNERHLLRAHSTMRMVCVFNPPITGREVHDQDGTYRPGAEIAGGQ